MTYIDEPICKECGSKMNHWVSRLSDEMVRKFKCNNCGEKLHIIYRWSSWYEGVD